MMNSRRCPICDRPLPATAKRCAQCGQPFRVSNSATMANGVMPKDSEHLFTLKRRPSWRPAAPGRFSSLLRSSINKAGRTTPRRDLSPLRHSLTLDEPDYHTPDEQDLPNSTAESLGETDALNALRPEPQATWQRVVESPDDATELTTYPPRPMLPSTIRVAEARSTPLITKLRRRYFSPKLFFWGMSCILVTFLVTVGVLEAMGRTLSANPKNNGPSLLVSPHEVAIGATLSLRGQRFAPGGQVGLTRDIAIPILDTASASVVRADGQGLFSDTVVVQADWGVGAHTIGAEDAISHKITSYPILVVGKGQPLRPAHLKLSTDSLDLGSGDQATNSKQTLTLTNQGSGLISWRGSATQSWLKISPESGTFYSGMRSEVIIAVDRANLLPGTYTAQVLFSSNAGEQSLMVRTTVIKLDPQDKAVLQLTPSVMSFTATDAGASPGPQVVTVSNPGVQTLNWQANSSASWLGISQQSGSLAPQGSSPMTISVNTSTLLPGTYNGTITFSAQDPETALHSPQSVDVSVTITPRCALTLTPSLVSFTAAYQQQAQLTKTVKVDASASCQSPLNWHVSSSESWLKTSQQSGTTSDDLAVGIDPGGLNPGTYSGTLTFSSDAGTQALLVNFILGAPDVPVLSLNTAAFSFHGIAATNDASTQILTLTNAGNGTLSWQATTETGAGGAWLSASPTSGTLGAQQSTQISVTANVLSGLRDGPYTGVINFSGTDEYGHPATGSSQSVPVGFTVRPACGLIASQTTLLFNGAGGQAPPAAHSVTLTASSTCTHSLAWSAQVSDKTWLSTTTTGTVSTTSPATLNANVSLMGLPLDPRPYTTSIALTATDTVTHAAVAAPSPLVATLNMQPACTLQAPSTTQVSFSTVAGQNPAAPSTTFTIGVTGTCSGNVTVTPSKVNNAGWLMVSSATTASVGSPASFTLTMNAAALAVAQYSETISFAAVSDGIAIVSSPQTVNVTLNVGRPPTLTVDAGAGGLTFEQTTGMASKDITLSNTGTGALNWNAALQNSAPAFVSLSTTTGNGLTLGSNTTVTVNVDTTNQTGSFMMGVVISATDATTGLAVAGSPITLPLTITIPPASLQLSATTLDFATTEGSNPDNKTVRLSNGGGGTLGWQASSSASWLTVSPATGNNGALGTSTLTCQVNTSGLTASTTPYSASVTITPSVGAPVTITVTLTVSATPPPVQTPNGSGEPTPSASASPTLSVQDVTVTVPPTSAIETTISTTVNTAIAPKP
jgi:hypothetical protein